LTLSPNGCAFRCVGVDGAVFDSGNGNCRGMPA
jgi:hypothetical protein